MKSAAKELSRSNVSRLHRSELMQSVLWAAVGILVIFGITYFVIGGARDNPVTEVSQIEQREVGPSGLMIPRFVSLKSASVNMRRGPSRAHSIDRVYKRLGLPMEVVKEYDVWRKVRYLDGEAGWIHSVMLSGRRTGVVLRSSSMDTVPLFRDRNQHGPITANLEPNVQVIIDSCDGTWCRVEASNYQGYVPQHLVWGVYEGELIN